MKKENICDFGDILWCAEKLGYKWNEAHDILDNYVPRYGMRHVSIDDIKEEEDEDAKKILTAFFKQEKIDEFYFTPKST